MTPKGARDHRGDPLGTVDRLMMSGIENQKRIGYLKKKVRNILILVENSRRSSPLS